MSEIIKRRNQEKVFNIEQFKLLHFNLYIYEANICLMQVVPKDAMTISVEILNH